MIHVTLAVVLLALDGCAGRADRSSAQRSPFGGRGGGRGAEGRSADQPDSASLAGDSTLNAAAGYDVKNEPEILFLGTSLTAGLGVTSTQAYPWLIQRRLDSQGLRWHTINGGLSGETSAGLVRRLDWLLAGNLRIAIIETGANDGLRGLDVDSTRANIETVIAQVRAFDSTTQIVLAGMEVPPNLGARYAARFRSLFSDLARREHVQLIPFLLAGVGGVDSLNQADGIHPNPAGHRIVAENVWRVIEPIIRREGRGAPRARPAGR